MSDTITPRTEKLLNYISDCAKDLDVYPAEVEQKQFRRWLIDNEIFSDVENEFRHMRRIGGYNALRDAFFCMKTPDEKLLIKKEATASRKQSIETALENSVNISFSEAMSIALSKGLPKLYDYALKTPSAPASRVVQVLLSDLHFGSDLKDSEGFTKYGFKEEARAVASIVQRVCAYKEDHRKDTELLVLLGGDLIKGKIHAKEYSLPLAHQFADATYMLIQAMRIFASHFKKVTIKCVTGNHDRNPDQKGLAIDGRTDSEASKIYFALKMALAEVKNVTVDIPMTQYHSFEVFGEREYLGHGDINLNPGYVGSVVNVKSLENQINNLNIGAIARGEKPFRTFLLGHVHVGALIHLPMGDLITNGTIIPNDAYAQAIGYYTSARGQTMFESVPGHMVGDYRFLAIDDSVYKDKSLDSLIKAYSGEF